MVSTAQPGAGSEARRKWDGQADVEAETQYFGHLMQRADSFEKTLMMR